MLLLGCVSRFHLPPAVEPLPRPIPRVCAISSAAGGGVRELELEGLMIHADEVLRISLSLVPDMQRCPEQEAGGRGRQGDQINVNQYI